MTGKHPDAENKKGVENDPRLRRQIGNLLIERDWQVRRRGFGLPELRRMQSLLRFISFQREL